MKGISLPINVIIIVAVAVLVMIVVSAFFVSSTGSGISAISHNEAWSRGCAQATARGCATDDFASGGLIISGYDPNGDKVDDDLATACKNALGYTSASQCREQCCGRGAVVGGGATPTPAATPVARTTPTPAATPAATPRPSPAPTPAATPTP